MKALPVAKSIDNKAIWLNPLFIVAIYYSTPDALRGFDPLLLFFMNEIKIVSYSFSSSVIEYNSNEKLLEA